MSRRAHSHTARLLPGSMAGLALALVLAALPAAGIASSGGASPAGGPNPPSGRMGTVEPGDVTVTASGDGVTLSTRASGFLHTSVRFSGTVPSGWRGRDVEIQRLGRETAGQWRATVHGRAARNGSFNIVWNANHIGRFAFRVVLSATRAGHAASVSSPSLQATIFRTSIATYYGPGFWGSTTACGQRLTPRTLGVANRTLPCGTPVDIYWGGHTIIVPVIDRGPYANGADWDLTQATATKLGITSTVTLGAVSLPRGR